LGSAVGFLHRAETGGRRLTANAFRRKLMPEASMPDELKPFTIYDDDEDQPPKKAWTPSEESGSGLDLEMVDDKPDPEDAARRKLFEDLSAGDPVAPPPSGPKVKTETEEASPFLHGEAGDSIEARSREIIQRRRDAGKIHDRRRTASIFDKPIEPDRPVRMARSRWHPLAHPYRGLWFLGPALLCFGLFFLYPMVKGFLVSLTHFNPLGVSVPVGWENYQRAFSDDQFGQTVLNATALTLISLVFGFWPPVFLAIILNELKRGKALFRVLFLVPFVVPAVPAANLWKWMYDDGFGVLNALCSYLPGSPSLGWLTDPKWALISISIMFVWKNTGWFMILYYAALQNLPEQLYEAAELDGAGIWKKVRHVTLPHLVPVMGMLFILQVLNTFQIFTEVYVMTGGGPMRTTEVMGTYIYKTAFGEMDLGYAAAMGMLMFAALFVFSTVRVAQLRKTEA
jgi:multiple sugar transport system permease protein